MVVRLANVILPAGILAWLVSGISDVRRSVWYLLPFSLMAAFQIVIVGLYGSGVIAVDMFLNVVTTNSSEACELLGNLFFPVVAVCLIYLPPVVMSLMPSSARDRVSGNLRKWMRKCGIALTGAGMLLLAVCYASVKAFSVNESIYPCNVAYNLYLAVKRTIRTEHYRETSEGYTYNPVLHHADSIHEVAVIVVGETSRAENWQLLGYGRATNPLLAGRRDLIVAPEAFSESNTTHKSVPMLLSPVDAATFDEDIYKVKSLVTAFAAAGYSTAFISNQCPNHSFIDFFGAEADTTVYMRGEKEKNGGSVDFDMIPVVNSILGQKHRKQLIVVHSYGSHFDYRHRYPDVDARFRPDDYQCAAKEERERLLNAYDNTIVSTDRFLNGLIEILERENLAASFLLYASDHGENIFDDGTDLFLHASPCPSVHEVHVPMLCWLSPLYISKWPEVRRNMKKNMSRLVSTSRSFCPTALNMAGIESDRIERHASLTGTSYVPHVQIYLNDRNKAVRLKEIMR